MAIRTPPPVRDLGLVDLVSLVVGGRETGRGPGRAVHVHDAAADAADQMVVVVADATLETRRRSGGLNSSDEALGDQNPERVVHRLERNGTDLSPDDLGHSVSGDVRLSRYRSQHSQSLSRDLDTALTKEFGRIGRHEQSVDQTLE